MATIRLAQDRAVGNGVKPGDAHGAGAGCGESFDDFQGGGFAGPVGAEQTKYFTALYMEIQALDGGVVAVGSHKV